jgi:heat shock protein HtpX
MNTLKTGFLMILMTALIVGIGSLFGHGHGVVIAFAFAVIMNVGSYWFSDKIVLSMYRARPVTEVEAPGLYSLVGRLATQAGLPMPKLYIVPNDMPNAFATGRNPQHAAVAVTDGLMRILDQSEVEGVIAHELAHVKNRDILISTIAATMAGAIMMASHMARFAMIFGGYGGRDRDRGGIGALVAIIVAPIAAMMIQFAISRSREYQADATGAQISGRPMGLANALLKLESASKYVPSTASPATAHMFIVNPLNGRGMMGLFSTHPPIQDRVQRLESIAREMGQS